MGPKRALARSRAGGVFGHPSGGTQTGLRAGLYARVSTHDQQTLPMQSRAMREYAARRGWQIVLQVKEIASGASQRESREKLLAAARRREIDVVLVWRLDRWGRSVTDLLATLQELEHLGVGFVSLTEALDLTTPAGRASSSGRSCANGFAPAWSMHGATASAWAGQLRRLFTPTRSGVFIVPASAKPKSPAGFRLGALRCAAFWRQRGDKWQERKSGFRRKSTN